MFSRHYIQLGSFAGLNRTIVRYPSRQDYTITLQIHNKVFETCFMEQPLEDKTVICTHGE